MTAKKYRASYVRNVLIGHFRDLLSLDEGKRLQQAKDHATKDFTTMGCTAASEVVERLAQLAIDTLHDLEDNILFGGVGGGNAGAPYFPALLTPEEEDALDMHERWREEVSDGTTLLGYTDWLKTAHTFVATGEVKP